MVTKHKLCGPCCKHAPALRIIESPIIINKEILLQDGDHFSKSYYHSFPDLSRLKVFEEKELFQLAGIGGFRNRLAHEYVELSQADILKQMKEILKLYPKYLGKIQQYLI